MIEMERQIGNLPQSESPTAKVDMHYNRHPALYTCLRLRSTCRSKLHTFRLVALIGGFNIHLTHASSISGIISQKHFCIVNLSWSSFQVFAGTLLIALVRHCVPSNIIIPSKYLIHILQRWFNLASVLAFTLTGEEGS